MLDVLDEFKAFAQKTGVTATDQELAAALARNAPASAAEKFAESQIDRLIKAFRGVERSASDDGLQVWYNPDEKSVFISVGDWVEDSKPWFEAAKSVVSNVDGESESGPGKGNWEKINFPEKFSSFAEHRFASTQFNLPEEIADQILQFAADLPEEDVLKREDRPHVTVRYGLHTANPKLTHEIAAPFGKITVALGATSIFPAGPECLAQRGGDCADVLKIDVFSRRLHMLHDRLGQIPHTDTHPEYHPHVTIAYMKPGTGEKYAGSTRFAGMVAICRTMLLSDQDGDQTPIPLQHGEGFEAFAAKWRQETDHKGTKWISEGGAVRRKKPPEAKEPAAKKAQPKPAAAPGGAGGAPVEKPQTASGAANAFDNIPRNESRQKKVRVSFHGKDGWITDSVKSGDSVSIDVKFDDGTKASFAGQGDQELNSMRPVDEAGKAIVAQAKKPPEVKEAPKQQAPAKPTESDITKQVHNPQTGLDSGISSIATAGLTDKVKAGKPLSDADLEKISENVHDEWMERERSRPDGVRETRKHLMVPYADLSEEEKEKDREFARQAAAAMRPEGYFGSKEQPYWRPGPNPTVDNIITRHGPHGKEVLLIRRKPEAPTEGGKWALPGGFHDTDAKKGEPWKPGKETAKEAALRELQEESSLDLSHLAGNMFEVGKYDKRGRDPRDNPEAWSTSTAFSLHVPDNAKISDVVGKDDADRAEWVPIKNLGDKDIAFDHMNIISDAMKKQATPLDKMMKPGAELPSTPKGNPLAQGWLKHIANTGNQDAVLDAMRAIDVRVESERDQARRKTPRQGTIGIGGADFEHHLEAESRASFLRALHQGKSPAEALDAAKADSRAMIKHWNEKASRGRMKVNNPRELDRWEGAADAGLETAYRQILRASMSPTEAQRAMAAHVFPSKDLPKRRVDELEKHPGFIGWAAPNKALVAGYDNLSGSRLVTVKPNGETDVSQGAFYKGPHGRNESELLAYVRDLQKEKAAREPERPAAPAPKPAPEPKKSSGPVQTFRKPETIKPKKTTTAGIMNALMPKAATNHSRMQVGAASLGMAAKHGLATDGRWLLKLPEAEQGKIKTAAIDVLRGRGGKLLKDVSPEDVWKAEVDERRVESLAKMSKELMSAKADKQPAKIVGGREKPKETTSGRKKKTPDMDRQFLIESPGGKKASLDADYVELIRQRYPNSTMHLDAKKPETGPVHFKVGGETVGLVMPLDIGGEANVTEHSERSLFSKGWRR